MSFTGWREKNDTDPAICNCGCEASIAFSQVMEILMNLEPKDQEKVLKSVSQMIKTRFAGASEPENQEENDYDQAVTPSNTRPNTPDELDANSTTLIQDFENLNANPISSASSSDDEYTLVLEPSDETVVGAREHHSSRKSHYKTSPEHYEPKSHGKETGDVVIDLNFDHEDKTPQSEFSISDQLKDLLEQLEMEKLD